MSLSCPTSILLSAPPQCYYTCPTSMSLSLPHLNVVVSAPHQCRYLCPTSMSLSLLYLNAVISAPHQCRYPCPINVVTTAPPQCRYSCPPHYQYNYLWEGEIRHSITGESPTLASNIRSVFSSVPVIQYAINIFLFAAHSPRYYI